MTANYSPTPFEAHCQHYKAWIIEYRASSLDGPRYLVWYSHTDADEDSQDRILSYKSGKMYAEQSLAAMQAGILDNAADLIMLGNVMDWLRNFGDLEVSVDSTYDLLVIEEGLAAANLDIPTLEGCASFINLFNDYVEQDPRNSDLQSLSDHELIWDVWHYYYNYIFWPRFNDKEKFEAWDRPPLEIDTPGLLSQFRKMKQAFEACMQERA